MRGGRGKGRGDPKSSRGMMPLTGVYRLHVLPYINIISYRCALLVLLGLLPSLPLAAVPLSTGIPKLL